MSDELVLLAEDAIQRLRAKRVQGYVSFHQTTGFSVSARLGEVETVEHHDENHFNITVYDDHRTGSAATSDFSKDALNATIDKAITIARVSESDPCNGLPPKDRLAFKPIHCDLYHPWDITIPDAIGLAIQCEQKAMHIDRRIVNSEGVSVNSLVSIDLLANTEGLTTSYRSSEHAIHCGLIAKEKDEMQRDFDYTIARNPKDLLCFDAIATKTAEKTVNRLGSRPVNTQTCPVVFKASTAKSLLGHFVQAVSGSNLYRQSSFLLNALSAQIFPSFLSIYQEPHLLSAMGSHPYDQEGVTTDNLFYVKEGVLKSYVLSNYSAHKLGLETTGNAGGVFNLTVTTQEPSLEALLSRMGTGLLVTELMGQGVNITTGDYSRAATGFWVENGKIKFPVSGVTVAGNLRKMFADIGAISNDVDVRGSIRSGSILIKEMTLAGE